MFDIEATASDRAGLRRALLDTADDGNEMNHRVRVARRPHGMRLVEPGR